MIIIKNKKWMKLNKINWIKKQNSNKIIKAIYKK